MARLPSSRADFGQVKPATIGGIVLQKTALITLSMRSSDTSRRSHAGVSIDINDFLPMELAGRPLVCDGAKTLHCS